VRARPHVKGYNANKNNTIGQREQRTHVYPFTRGRARTVQVVLAYGICLHYIPSHVVVHALFKFS
jgi:hypothetical protein